MCNWLARSFQRTICSLLLSGLFLSVLRSNVWILGLVEIALFHNLTLGNSFLSHINEIHALMKVFYNKTVLMVVLVA